MKLSERKLRRMIRNEIRNNLNENRGRSRRLNEEALSPSEIKTEVKRISSRYPALDYVLHELFTTNSTFHEAIRDYGINEFWIEDVDVNKNGWELSMVCNLENSDLAPNSPRRLKTAVEQKGYKFNYGEVGTSTIQFYVSNA